MRLIFAGTPEFAATALAALLAAGHEVPLALTQPDRPAGRGMAMQASAVKQLAMAHGIPLHQPERLKDPATHEPIRAACAAGAEVMVVAAYGLILPQWVLDAPARGCFNSHASWLPRGRGAAPIHRAIEAGDSETGITIMQMDAGLDTGDMLFMHTTPITKRDTTGTLHDRLADLGGKLIVLALNQAAAGHLKPVWQPAEGVTYAHKIEKAEGAVDWSLPATQIERRIRAFDPFPGASSALAGETVKLWESHVDSMKRPSDAGNGQILFANDDGVRIACGDGVLCVTQLQRAGGKRLAAADFLRGFALGAGATFDAPPAAA